MHTTERVDLDHEGSNAHPRLTLHPCGSTLIRQPHMTGTTWRDKIVDLLADVPVTTEVRVLASGVTGEFSITVAELLQCV